MKENKILLTFIQTLKNLHGSDQNRHWRFSWIVFQETFYYNQIE